MLCATIIACREVPRTRLDVLMPPKRLEPKLTYGLSANDALIHISEVTSGLKCHCRCPECNTPLIARKGEILQNHFAHANSDALRNCKGGTETALHWYAKQAIAEANAITIPRIDIRLPELGDEHTFSSKEQLLALTDCQLEKQAGNIVPDLIVTALGRKLFVEIFVTHKVDTEKLYKVKMLDASMIEIDLSSCERDCSPEKIKDLAVSTAPRRWIHNIKEDKFKRELKQKFAISVQKLVDEYHQHLANLKKQTPEINNDLVSLSLSEHTGLWFEGCGAFKEHPAIWQGKMLRFLLKQSKSRRFSSLANYVEKAYVRQSFKGTSKVLEKVRQSNRAYSWESALEAWFGHLIQHDILMSISGKDLTNSYLMLAEHVAARPQQYQEAIRYKKQISVLLTALTQSYTPDRPFLADDKEKWIMSQFPDIARVLNRDFSGGAWSPDVKAKLHKLGNLLEALGNIDRPPPTDILNLPFETMRQNTMARYKARREFKAQQTKKEQQEKEFGARWSSVIAKANSIFGDASKEWLLSNSSLFGGRSPEQVVQLEADGLEQVEKALADIELELIRQIEQERLAQQKIQLALEAQQLLEEKLRAYYPDKERRDVFMKCAHPKLGKVSPRDYCKDARKVNDVIALLDASKRKPAWR